MHNLALPWKERCDRYAESDEMYNGMLEEIESLVKWVRKGAIGKMALGFEKKDMEEYVAWVKANPGR
jgi:hypothetical protein